MMEDFFLFYTALEMLFFMNIIPFSDAYFLRKRKKNPSLPPKERQSPKKQQLMSCPWFVLVKFRGWQCNCRGFFPELAACSQVIQITCTLLSTPNFIYFTAPSRLLTIQCHSSGLSRFGQPQVLAVVPARNFGALKDEDRIFTNIYGRHDWRLKGALKVAFFPISLI